MSYIHHLATLSGTDKNNLQACLEKLDKRQSISNQEAKNCSLAISKLNKVITDRPLIDHFIKLLSTAFQLNSQETDSLKQMVQSSRNIASFNNDAEYLTIIKIAKTLQSYHSQFRPISNLNNFFNQLHSDTAFKAIIGIIKAANLTDALAIELLKAQYRSSYPISSRTDELTKAIIKVDKFSILPEKAFNNLTTHLGKKFSFTADNIKILQQLEKNGNKDLAKTLYNAFKDKSNIQYMPKITRELLQNLNSNINKNGVEKYLKTVSELSVPQSVRSELYGYKDVLIEIEQGKKKPYLADIKTLDLIYNEFKGRGKLDTIPKLTLAYLKNRHAEQSLKKKFSNNPKAQEILKKTASNQTLKLMEAIYLNFYFTHLQLDMPPSTRTQIHNALARYPDIHRSAGQIKELIDSKAIAIVEKMMKQIKNEHRFNEKNIKAKVPYLSKNGEQVEIHHNSEFMELRVVKYKAKSTEDAKKKAINAFIKNVKANKYSNGIPEDIKNFGYRVHEGVDYTGIGHDGIVKYQPDSKIKPTIARLINVKKILDKQTKKVKEYDIIFMEFNEDNGVLFTTLRHLQQTLPESKIGTKLTKDTVLGTYLFDPRKAGKPANEHTHIERILIKPEHYSKTKDSADLLKELQKVFTKYEAFSREFASQFDWDKPLDSNRIEKIKFVNSDIVKMLLPLQNIGDGYHGVSLLMTGTYLNQQLLNIMEAETLQSSAALIQIDAIKNADDFLKFFANSGTGLLRDYLKLKSLNRLLTHAKTMLQAVGEYNNQLEPLMANIKNEAKILKEKWLAKNKIIRDSLQKNQKNI